eukprot:GFYU01004128.1.p1 GENE.GFYU01004128.1~~GFYU01004128.1.p1  ORF type:complete len:258 (+),score=10.42 GFYU01004128.1:120-893(+)
MCAGVDSKLPAARTVPAMAGVSPLERSESFDVRHVVSMVEGPASTNARTHTVDDGELKIVPKTIKRVPKVHVTALASTPESVATAPEDLQTYMSRRTSTNRTRAVPSHRRSSHKTTSRRRQSPASSICGASIESANLKARRNSVPAALPGHGVMLCLGIFASALIIALVSVVMLLGGVGDPTSLHYHCPANSFPSPDVFPVRSWNDCQCRLNFERDSTQEGCVRVDVAPTHVNAATSTRTSEDVMKASNGSRQIRNV